MHIQRIAEREREIEGWRGLPSVKPGEGYLYLSLKQQGDKYFYE
jgi:hypothetical protein